MCGVELVAFGAEHAATVAGWPRDADESARWCGRRDVTPETVTAWSGPADVLAYVAVDSGRPVGYGEIWMSDDEIELARLIVAPGRRRTGVGRRLVGALIDIARTSGVEVICLRVHADNAAAIGVYRAAGFTEVDSATAAEWNVGQPVVYRWFAIGHQQL